MCVYVYSIQSSPVWSGLSHFSGRMQKIDESDRQNKKNDEIL